MNSATKVLCVDDQQAVRYVFGLYLGQMGYEVIEAEDGAQCLEVFIREKPDIVLLDLRMPGMGGLEALSELTRLEPETPVIVVSGVGEIEDSVQALRRGAWDYLIKPIQDVDILQHAMDKALERAQLLKRSRRHQKDLEQEVMRRTAALEAEIQDRRRAEEQYRSIFENALEGIFQVCFAGCIQGANLALARIFGFDSVQDMIVCVGDQAKQLWVDTAEAARFLADLRREKTIVGFEAKFYRKDGSTFWALINARLTRSADGHAEIIEGMLQDVTERRRAASYRQAKLEAEAASEAKSSFLAMMSHEIRTPLNAITGMTDLALRAEPKESVRRYLEMVRDAGRSLMTIINNILDFSKIEAGKLVLEDIDFDLSQLLKDAVTLFSAPAAEKGLAIDLFLGDHVPEWVRGDPTRLRQVLGNLVNNAIKFTLSGGVTVSVARDDVGFGGPQAGPGDLVRLLFSVKDTGVGIARDKQRTVFECFSQADDSTTRRFGGSGLGLTICIQLVELMGGDMSVESEPGKGSVFYFSLPFVVGREAVEALNSHPEQSDGLVAPMRILLVEDNVLNRELVSIFLGQLQHTVVCASNGVEALDWLARERFDLVLMDIQMPEMDGVEACRRIRNGAHGVNAPDVPIIAITAHAFEGSREKYLEMGMTDYISKPIELDRLQAAVEACAGALRTDAGNVDATQATSVPAEKPETDAPLLNEAGALRRMLDNQILLNRMKDMFLRTTPGELQALRAMLDEKNIGKAAICAHSLKGSAASVGAERFSSIAKIIELALRKGDERFAFDHIQELEKVYAQTVSLLSPPTSELG